MSRASDLERAIDRLVRPEQGVPRFEPAPAVGPRPGAVTTGRPSSSGGVGGAFAEKDYSKREYYSDRSMTSSDGIITIVWSPIKSLLLTSNDLATFKEPPAEPEPEPSP